MRSSSSSESTPRCTVIPLWDLTAGDAHCALGRRGPARVGPADHPLIRHSPVSMPEGVPWKTCSDQGTGRSDAGRRQRGPGRYRRAGKIGGLVQEALDAGSGAGLSEKVGQATDAAMVVLKSIGLGNPSMERLPGAGKSAGARGGKVSGAGGGGAFYLVADSRRAAVRISGVVRPQEKLTVGTGAARAREASPTDGPDYDPEAHVSFLPDDTQYPLTPQ